jgi:foldase protein PrsA
MFPRILTGALALCLLFSAVPARAQKTVDDLVLAVVNGEEITRKRLADRLVEYRGEDALEKAINRVILQQEAKRLKVTPDEKKAEQKLQELQRKFKTDSDYRGFLTRSRLTEKQLREEFRNTVLLQQVALKEQPLSEQDLEQLDVAIIVVPTRAAAEKVIKDLDKAKFSETAAKENTDPALKRANGKLKPFLKVEMLDLSRAIEEQKVLPAGFTKTPVELGPDRWGIIRLERRIPVSQAGLERDRLEATVISFRVNEWLGQARAKAKVEKKPLTESVVATVNGEPITRAELVSRLLEYQGEEALEQMVNRVLLLQSAKNVSVPNDDVEKRFAAARKQFRSPEAYQAFLTRSNLTERQFKDEIRYTLLMEKVALRETPITDDDLQRYEIRLITTPSLSDAQQWIKGLNDGGDFVELAQDRATVPEQRQSGGRLRPFVKVEMLDLWRAIVDQKLKPGQYTKMPVLLTDNTWALIKLENILPASSASKEERERLRGIVTNYRVSQWLVQARAKAKFAYPTTISQVVKAPGE